METEVDMTEVKELRRQAAEGRLIKEASIALLDSLDRMYGSLSLSQRVRERSAELSFLVQGEISDPADHAENPNAR